MSPLSASNLPENAASFDYERSAVTAGIVHFGIGNFHRAHQAVYVDDLLNQGQTQWGITGVSLRSPSLKDVLAPQDYLYTLAVLGAQTEYRVIGSIQNVLAARAEPHAVIKCLASPETQLVTSTITEKGYYIGQSGVNFEHADLQGEIASLDRPKTIYGFLARGIIERSKISGAPLKLTVLCCDNISGGGAYLKQGVERLLKQHDKNAFNWSQENTAFISSMVDRVSPATDEALKAKVLRDTKREDAWPVSAEPFSQWIIEKDFAGARPPFDTVGAVFVDDIGPFERMKLRYLNCAHTIISALGYLSADRYVHEALERPDILNFTRQALYEAVLPYAPVPKGYNGADYIESVIARFQNGNLPYGNLQVGTDSSQKIQQRWFPTIDHVLENAGDTSYFEFCLGAWIVFIKTALASDVLSDPKKDTFQKINTDGLDMMSTSYLEIANAGAFEFFSNQAFMMSVKNHAQRIEDMGIDTCLSAFLASR